MFLKDVALEVKNLLAQNEQKVIKGGSSNDIIITDLTVE